MGRFAGRQFGLIARRQLAALGVPSTTVADWTAGGYLFRRLPGVYAVGHTATSVHVDLAAALLWAGPYAMLSHACGAWWLGLARHRPPEIEICTPRRCQSRPGIVVHDRSRLERGWHRGLPVAPVSNLLVQYATAAGPDELRRATAEAEYRGWLDLGQLTALCGRGRPGSAKVKAALARHLPALAVAESEFERRLLYLCEAYGLPLPECNAYIEGFKVDAVWREHRLIVELDGKDGHNSWERIRRDHHRDLAHRRAGFTTLRYVWDQFENHGGLVAADIQAAISSAGPSAARGSR